MTGNMLDRREISDFSTAIQYAPWSRNLCALLKRFTDTETWLRNSLLLFQANKTIHAAQVSGLSELCHFSLSRLPSAFCFISFSS